MFNQEPPVDHLNSLLAGELAASKTYEEARPRISDDLIRDQLAEHENSHRQRAQQLRGCIEAMGAEPVSTSGVWNSFASLLQESIAGMKDKDAVAALQDEEDLGLRMYQEALENASDKVRELLLESLLPAQEYTLDALSILKFSIQ